MPLPDRARRGRGFLPLLLLALVAVLIPAGVMAAKPGPAAPVTVQLLNVSDWHGQIDPTLQTVLGVSNTPVGGAWSLAARFAEDRQAYPTLTLTAGDDFGATPPLSGFFNELPSVLTQRMMGIQVGALGNHNWDRGNAHLQQMIDFAGAPTDADHPGQPFRYLSANLANVDDNLSGVAPWHMYKVGDAKIAVIGITNEEAPGLVTPGSFGTIEVTDGVAAAEKYASIARKAGANAVVVITHKGFRGFDEFGAPFGELVDFANDLNPGAVDVILGDHTDIQFSATINGILVHEARSKGVSYAKTLLTVQPGKGGGVISKSASFVTPVAPVRTTAELIAAQCPDPTLPAPARYCDSAMLSELIGYRQQLAILLDVKVATTTASFPRGNAFERTQESAQGNLIADGMRWFQGSDIAIMNSGGIRTSLPSSYSPLADFQRPPEAAPWDLILGDIYSTLPFANTVLRRDITGAQLWAALENGVSRIAADGSGADGRFPQISGFKFAFDWSKATGCSGAAAVYACTPSRVYSVTWLDGTPIPADGTLISIAIPSFVNQGGDSYRVFNDGTPGENEGLDAAVFQSYLNFLGPIPQLTPTTDGRISRCGGCAPVAP
jgi:5'-nucleotidase